jgi:hypothetical protein
MLYDKASFHHALEDEDNQMKYNIIIRKEFFTEEEIKKLSSSNSVFRSHEKHVISDIRFTTEEKPTTADLIRDYTLENTIVMNIQPKTAMLKWRYPYLDKEDNETVFERVQGSVTEEWLQPFAKPTSSELRLYLEGPVFKLKEIRPDDSRRADFVMAAYKVIDRYIPRLIKQEDMLLSSCRCNDCSLLNLIAVDCRNHGIELDVQDFVEASGYLSK